MATKILSEPEVTTIADVKMGDCEATAWGCDLTHEYVSIMQITEVKKAINNKKRNRERRIGRP